MGVSLYLPSTHGIALSVNVFLDNCWIDRCDYARSIPHNIIQSKQAFPKRRTLAIFKAHNAVTSLRQDSLDHFFLQVVKRSELALGKNAIYFCGNVLDFHGFLWRPFNKIDAFILRNVHFHISRSIMITISSLTPDRNPGNCAVDDVTTDHPWLAYAFKASSSLSGSNLPLNHLSFCERTLYSFIFVSLGL